MTEPLGTDGPRLRERLTTRTARYAMVGAEPSSARRIWIALHGYGMLAARFLRPFQGAVPADTCVVAPEGLSRFYLESPRTDGSHLQKVGATWLTRESRDTEIVDAHRWLDLVHDEVAAESQAGTGLPPSVAILGFSQGVATAMRWTASGRVRPQQFVAWAGGLAADVDVAAFTAAMQSSEFVLVAGDDDPFVTAEVLARTTGQLSTWGVTHRVQRFVGAHQLDTPLLETLLSSLPAPRSGS